MELDDHWRQLANDLALPSGHLALRDELERAYREPHRRYHTTAHLRAVLDTLAELWAVGRGGLGEGDGGASPRPPPAARLAAWFHDVVYEPRRTDNEAASARLVVDKLRPLDVDEGVIAMAASMVSATAEHTVPSDTPGAAELLDADLAVLASGPADYERYVVAVREEHAHVDDEGFAAGRAAVLGALVARPRLFHSAAGRARFERAARANVGAELVRLRS